MARVRVSMVKSLCCSASKIQLKPVSSYVNSSRYVNQGLLIRSYHASLNQDFCRKEFKPAAISGNAYCKILNFESSVVTQYGKSNSMFSTTLLKSYHRSAVLFSSMSFMSGQRSFSSSSGKTDGPGTIQASSETNVDGNGSDVGIDWIGKAKETWENAADTMSSIGQKSKEKFDELAPHGQQFLDSHPYLREVIVPVGYTCVGTVLAWVVMPRLLRMFHKYSMQSPAALLSRGTSLETLPYEKSFWGALEDPVRYLVTFMAFLQIGNMVAPTTIASQYIAQAWRGAVVLSFIWFLYRWKTNVVSRALSVQSLAQMDKERVLTLDKVSSVGLFVIGLMALAEACGVAVQSILTVGGIGGVATAFAARDILGNVLSGFSMQLSKPFSLGDTIKAGSIEGQVVEMGLTTTMLLNAEKFPVIVPNSLFSSQVIVNNSRAQWRAFATKIPVNSENLDKIPQVSNDIKSMLRLNPNVFLGKEAPYCFLSGVESSFAELTIGCNLKQLSKDELYTSRQDILLQSVQVLKQHGISLGSTWTAR